MGSHAEANIPTLLRGKIGTAGMEGEAQLVPDLDL